LSRNQIEHLTQTLHSSSEGRRRKAAEALRQLGEPGRQLSIESLIHMMLNDTMPLRKAAAEILREWREYVPIEPLFLAMQDTNAEVRSAAQWALADVGEYAPQESLLSHLADADTVVVNSANVRRFLRRMVGNRRETWESTLQTSIKWLEKRAVVRRCCAFVGERLPSAPMRGFRQGKRRRVG
jgi:hypothetical protein